MWGTRGGRGAALRVRAMVGDRADAIEVGSVGVFFEGRDQLRSQFFEPFVSVVDHAALDFSVMSHRVIGPLVISYGAIPGEGELLGGIPFAQPPLPQVVAWLQRGDRWLVIAAHE